MAEKIQRCAVYTRKSTEDGLEKEFNSLDAQYEACAAYALSQKHEGWELVSERYDDGGFSGGNMDRPGLKRLMADVAAGKVDIILVYKIDRLTRSLADFAKIVDVLDTAKASFVSITQSFNTTTSMGRLTLNMLLSFAQFEREVTGERIRDKIAASKRKGMWMGGPLPLGYDVENRRLIVNAKEAELVRQIYQRYLELGSVVELADDLNAKGFKTKVQQKVSGPHRGGCTFRRGTLYHLLSNPIYRGKIVHKGEVYTGEHEAIVPEDLFQAVQDKLKANASGISRRLRGQQPSLLTGILSDSAGRAMTPSHASKGKAQRYRYYVTRLDQAKDQPAYRVSAHDLEQIVTTKLAAYFAAPSNIAGLTPADIEAHTLHHALGKADITAATLRSGTAKAKHAIITAVLRQATLYEDRVELTLSLAGLADTLALPLDPSLPSIMLSVPAQRQRRGHQIRLMIAGEGMSIEPVTPPKPARDDKLIALLAEAHAARQLVLDHPETALAELARQQGKCRKHLCQLIELSCLAPGIVEAIMAGKQPVALSTAKLRSSSLPLSWNEQRALLLED
ncbi:recombinase family protein [Novosphingobium sp. NPDC080210]|uniref:recombinase family protein n=1 Tax=Novosphingobium sp. NPDC080210 TaxID=3390596 RepID=UPI003CFDCAAA